MELAPTPAASRRRAVVFLLGAALLWSTGGVLIKWVSWHPMAISGMRSLIAAAFLLLFARGLRRPGAPEFWGALAYAATVILFVLATKWTTAANAILLQYTAPVWVALLGGWLLGERARLPDWLAIFAVLGGMTLFLYEGLAGGGLAGDLVAIASGVAFGGLALAMRRQRGSALTAIILGNLIAAAAGVPFYFDGPPPDASGWLGLGLLGVLQLGVAYLLYSKAVAHVSALEIILIPVIEPLLNPLWAWLVFSEAPGAWSLAGGAIVLGAVTARGLWQARVGRGASED